MGRQVKYKRAVIFCWSESHRLPFEITDEDYIICADSGYNYASRLGIKPHLLLGDFDSYSATGTEAEKMITLPAEKDDTDAMYAVKVAVEKGFDEILIAGGIGGRADHTRGAVSVLKYLRDRCRGYISDGCTRIDIVNGGESLTIPYDERIRYVSVFPSERRAYGVTLKGLKYELSDYVLDDHEALGVSNEQRENSDSVISCESGGLEVYTVYKD